MQLLKWFVVLGLFVNFIFTSCNSAGPGITKERVLVCGDSKVLVVNQAVPGDTLPEVVWSWDAHQAEDLPLPFRTKKFNSTDDCKAVNGGEWIMVSSSSGAVAVVTFKERKVLFYADVPNAHSVEMLPGQKIVAAASVAENGNKLMLFEMSMPPVLLWEDSLYSAHGVVWDEKRELLFALGYDVLREYKLTGGDSLALTNEYKIPGISGHDLQISPEGERLFITEHTGAWQFNLTTREFAKIEGFPDAENIKSINQNKAGRYVYTVPEESWWTYHVSFYNPAGKLPFPQMHVYKTRWY